MEKFFNAIIESIIRNINFEVVKCLIIASPGFIREDFYKYLLEQIDSNLVGQGKNGTSPFSLLNKNKSKILLVHSSTGHKHSLNEILSRPEVQTAMQNTKAAGKWIKRMRSLFSIDVFAVAKAKWGRWRDSLKCCTTMKGEQFILTGKWRSIMFIFFLANLEIQVM